MRTLGQRVLPLEPAQGFAAQTSAAGVLLDDRERRAADLDHARDLGRHRRRRIGAPPAIGALGRRGRHRDRGGAHRARVRRDRGARRSPARERRSLTVYRAGVETAARHLRLLSDVVTAATSIARARRGAAARRGGDRRRRSRPTRASCTSSTRRSDELVLGASVGSVPRDGPTPRMRVGEGITGHAAADRSSPSRSPTPPISTRASAGFANLDEEAFESILAVPVLARGKPRRRAQRAYPRAAGVRRGRGRAAADDRGPARPGDRERPAVGPIAAPDRRARGARPHRAGRARADRPRRGARRCRPAPPPRPPTPTCARSRCLPRAGQPFEVAVRSSDVGATTRDARRRRAHAPRSTSRVCSPCRSRRGAAASARSSARASRGPPFTRAERALLGSVAAQAATAVVGRARRDAEPARPGDPPPRQEQPADRGLAAAARRLLRRRPAPRAARLGRSRALDRRGARPADLDARGGRRLRRPGAPPHVDAAPDRGRGHGRDRRSRRSCCGPTAPRRSRWSTASCTPTPWSTAAAFGISFCDATVRSRNSP